ncbi:MAG TPA: hypothetical protein VKY65_18865 [Alphaproteobacteria bacterium]|nr:hypothetical protein [Alphaproteobacteria bacterium]
MMQTAALVAQAPALGAVARFAEQIRRISWFVAVGEPLLEAELADARAYLAALGFAEASVAAVTNWAEAERCVRDLRWDRGWWAAEEELRRELLTHVRGDGAAKALMAALTGVTSEATAVLLGMASTAALRRGIAQQAIDSVAAGAATQACYQAALALAAAAGDDHPFALKLRLFVAGHWPLGLVDGCFYVF